MLSQDRERLSQLKGVLEVSGGEYRMASKYRGDEAPPPDIVVIDGGEDIEAGLAEARQRRHSEPLVIRATGSCFRIESNDGDEGPRDFDSHQLVGLLAECGRRIAIRRSRRWLEGRPDVAAACFETREVMAAVLDSGGRIVAVNSEWFSSAEPRGFVGASWEMGGAMVESLATKQGPGADVARELAAGLGAVVEGRLRHYRRQFFVESEDRRQWFECIAHRLASSEAGHVGISFAGIGRSTVEEAAREGLIEDEAVGQLILQDGQVAFANRAVHTLGGCPPSELRSMPVQALLQLVHPDDRELFSESMKGVMTGRDGTTMRVRIRVEHPDGQQRWYEGQVSRIQFLDRPAVQLIYLDVTGRARAEERLLESESLYHSLVAHLPICVFRKDAAGCYTFANRRFCELFGVAATEVIGRTDEKLFPRGLAEKFLGEDLRVLEDGATFEGEDRIQDAEGHSRLVRMVKSPLWNAEGKVNGLQGVFWDVTEERRTEERLRTSESRYRRLADTNVVGIFVGDYMGAVAEANDGFLRILGFSGDDLAAGRIDLKRITPEAHQGRDLDALDELLTTGACAPYEKVFIRKDGKSVPVLVGAALLEGSEHLVIAQVIDLSELHRSQATLKVQNRILELATDVVVVRGLDGAINYWNAAAAAVFGWSKEHVAGRKVQELIYPDRKRYEELTKIVLKEGRWEGELTVQNRTGQDVHLLSRWSLVVDENDQPTGVLNISTDITEKKKLEAQYFRSQRMEMIGHLAGGIAHDLNNILAPVLMCAPMLRSQLQDPEDVALLKTMEISARRGAELIKQLLAFGRGQPEESAPIQLKHVVTDLVAILQETFPRNIRLRCEHDPQPWLVSADVTQMHQLLLNLCVNARDAMPQGGTLTISVHNRKISEEHDDHDDVVMAPGDYLLVRVSDTGEGIPAGKLGQIFEPFYTTKDPGRGTGLGLATVQTIVQRHGGVIQVESTPGEGTQFSVYLPADQHADEPPPEIKGEIPNGHGELILVVDDEASIRNVLQRTLSRHGYRVVAAADGMEGLAEFTRNQELVRAVITDLMMPVMSGTELVRALRAIDTELVIIATTGNLEASGGQQSASGASALVMKPFTTRQMLALLAEQLRGPQRSSGG